MFIVRLRNQFKSKLKRGSWGYRAASRIFQCFDRAMAISGYGHKHREIHDNSIFLNEEELPMCSLFPKESLQLAWERFKPHTVLDVGCGTGVSLEWFDRKGIDVTGLEGSELAASKSRLRSKIRIHDFHQPLDLQRKFDLVWCYEVAEHIHPDHVDSLMSILTNHGDLIVVSAAKPGQGGCGHLNEQPPEYWISKFSQRGFDYDAASASLFHNLGEMLCENILVFTRRQA